MTAKAKFGGGQPALVVDTDVVRQIRQHARSSMKTEVCGVLIGDDHNGSIAVHACIQGVNAEEAGAHVTFTQDTWEHIYKIKDKEYPDDRIVGWYHTHPGFGVFLSDHDTFIHKNFFSSPGQVAWVYDPHSDEEGCFGWVGGRIERLSQIAVVDSRGGERADESGKPEPSYFPEEDSEEVEERRPVLDSTENSDTMSLQQLVTTFFSYLTVLLLGFLLCWYVFPRTKVLAIPFDPRTMQPIGNFVIDPSTGERYPIEVGKTPAGNPANGEAAGTDAKSDQDSPKGDHARPK